MSSIERSSDTRVEVEEEPTEDDEGDRVERTQAVPSFGDTDATYAGAFEPNASDDWTEGWTAFPQD